MCVLKIQYCDRNVTAFTIFGNGEERLYFLIYVPEDGVSEIYDNELQKMDIINIDDWFQVNTRQRYSHRSVLDMSAAFLNGLNSSYSLDDITILTRQSCGTVKDFLFHTDLISKYVRTYDIESADVGEIDSVITNIRDNWDTLLVGIGRDEFLNRLKRWVKYCRNNYSDGVPIFEKFIDRLSGKMGEPSYPDTGGYDEQLERRVLASVLIGRNKFKNISDKLLGQVDELQARRL